MDAANAPYSRYDVRTHESTLVVNNALSTKVSKANTFLKFDNLADIVPSGARIQKALLELDAGEANVVEGWQNDLKGLIDIVPQDCPQWREAEAEPDGILNATPKCKKLREGIFTNTAYPQFGFLCERIRSIVDIARPNKLFRMRLPRRL